MTEEEAKTKWCPFARVPGISLGGHGIAINRSTEDDPKQKSLTPKCIGSDCMAWREDLTRDEASQGFAAQSGHCGLAGNP